MDVNEKDAIIKFFNRCNSRDFALDKNHSDSIYYFRIRGLFRCNTRVDCCSVKTLSSNRWLNTDAIASFIQTFHDQVIVEYEASQTSDDSWNPKKIVYMGCSLDTMFSRVHQGTQTEQEVIDYIMEELNISNENINYNFIGHIHIPGHWLITIISPENASISVIDTLYDKTYPEFFNFCLQMYTIDGENSIEEVIIKC